MYHKYTGTNNLDGIGRDIVLSALNPNGKKKLDSVITGAEVPSTGDPPQSHRKMREAQIAFYIGGDRPQPARDG